ncbi:MAG: hypothetical protein EHM71_07580 [Zetaproteobacteria bacterium]|nr:MAG: hypothetical protein EHM71_07580 [Zetaproteobacteria bacterium]
MLRLRSALTIGLGLLLTVSAHTSAGEPRAERPTYNIGEKWLRSDGAYDLLRSDKDRYIFSAGPGQEIHLTRDLAIARFVRANQVVEFDPPVTIGWPLQVGKWGTSSGFWRTPDFSTGILARFTWSVDAYEDVQVPAGTFKAFRLSFSAAPTSSQLEARWPGRTGKLWYAPDARQFIKAEGRSEIALNDFQLVALDRPETATAPVRPPSPRAPGPPTPPGPSPPLAIDIRHPEDRAAFANPATIVAAVVTSGQGVAKVVVTLNGVEVFQQPENPPKPSVLLTAPVTLREGHNTVAIRATAADGASREVQRTLTYARPEGASGATTAKPAPARSRWAVVIGVGRYDRPDVPALRYAVADAERFHDVLVTQSGFQKENVLLLTDKTERKPTLRNIKWALGTFLARSAQKDDLVVIFFAGHGAPEIDPRGVESDGLAKYLVPADADPDDLYSTGLPMDELATIFSRIESDQVVVFLDACYSGAAGGRTFASRRTRASRIDDVFLERLTRSKGRVIVTASRANEVSLELPELGHGVFSHYLIQGIRGTADLDRDGIVSLQELYQYLEQEVSRKSRQAGGNQHPVMKGELEGVLPLVRLGGR